MAGRHCVDGEHHAPTGSAVVADAGCGPVEPGDPGQMHRVAGREVDEQQRRGGVDSKVPQAVEQVVARVVGPPQRPVVAHPDETRPAAAVRGVSAPVGVTGAEQEGVRSTDEGDISRVQQVPPADRGSRTGGRTNGLEEPLLDVLRAVAVGLVHVHGQPATARVDEGSVDPDAATAGELDGEHADGLRRRHIVQRVPCSRGGVYPQLRVTPNFEEPGRPGQRRDPQPSRPITGGQRGEGPLGEDAGEAAGEIGGIEHPREPVRGAADTGPALHGQLPGVESHRRCSRVNHVPPLHTNGSISSLPLVLCHGRLGDANGTAVSQPLEMGRLRW